MKFIPIQWGIGDFRLTIDLVKQRDGPDRYAVRHYGFCLNSKTGDMEYEPLPSGRDDEFLDSHRFTTWNEAEAAAQAWLVKEGQERLP